MFAPHHQEAADELVRVVAPGGRIGLVSWTPQGFIGQMFATMKPYVAPPPAGVSPPPLWGDEDHVRALLGDRVTDVRASAARYGSPTSPSRPTSVSTSRPTTARPSRRTSSSRRRRARDAELDEPWPPSTTGYVRPPGAGVGVPAAHRPTRPRTRPRSARLGSHLPSYPMTRSRLLGLGLGSRGPRPHLVAAGRRRGRTGECAPTTFTATGHGYGHGHGMSQYGAQGAAQQGLGWQQILDFYYPGTSRAPRREGQGADHRRHQRDVVVGARDGLRLTGSPAARLSSPRYGRRPVADQAERAEERGLLQDRGRWTCGRRSPATPSSRGQPAAHPLPAREGPLGVPRCAPLGREGHRERPAARPLPPGRGAARDAGHLEPDAVRAQAVAARTYAAYERAHPIAAHYEICDTTSCQVYGGVAAEHPAANAAVERDPRTGDHATDGRAGVHAVLLEQRRLDLCRARCPTWPPSRTRTTAGPATRTPPGGESPTRPIEQALARGSAT